MHHYNANDLGEVTVVCGPSILNYGARNFNANDKTYASIEDAVIAIGYHNVMALRDSPHLGGFRDHIVTKAGRYQRVPTYCEGGDGVHVFDDLGIRVPAWKLKEVAKNIPNDVWNYTYKFWRKVYREEDFRRAPIHGVRKRRWHHWRGIRTRQEIRENDFLDNYDEDAYDYGIKARGRRARANLPTLWDDIYRGDARSKNWKRHRAHQYKEK